MIVEAEGLAHSYGSRVALAGLDLQVSAGALVAVLGPNGCGKSTLFKLLATLLPLREGRATVAGFDLKTQAAALRRRLGVVFQSSSLDKRLTVAENLRAQGALYGLSGAALRERTSEVLRAFRLEDRARDFAGALSGGLQRRVEIAKALLHRPQLLLLDEASAGLDPQARRELMNELTRLQREQGLTALFTTHLMDEAEAADSVLLVHEGRAVRRGSPAELKRNLSGDVVVFRGGAPGLEARIAERFGVQAFAGPGGVRVEIADGHRFLAAALDAFPDCAEAVEVHRPSLEDVFFQATGSRFNG